MSSLPIDHRFALQPTQYFAEETPKNQILMHFTAGSTVAGAIATWNRDPLQVGTAFLVDRDGSIYQAFDPKYWAYHLGVTAAAGNTRHRFDRQSIGIEMINWGRLTQDERGFLYNWQRDPARPGRGKLTDTEALGALTLAQPYRGGRFWQAFPPVQLAAVRELVHSLCKSFAIPLQIPAPANRLTCDPRFAGAFRGIVGHQMYLADKTDPGPAFPWESLA
jgi:N-acetyl-anhydromuramyl-L-alanine amidase AmpD